MKIIAAIAWLTLKEGLRHRVLFGILIFALLFMSLAVLVCGMFMRDILKILLDFCLSAVAFGGLLVPFFLAINQLAGDFEQKSVYSILSLPVSRTSYIVGKFFGLSLLAAMIIGLLTCCALAAVWLAAHVYQPHYFEELSLSSVLLSSLANIAGVMVLNSMVILWCTLSSGAFLATLLTVATYLIGHSVEDMVHFMMLKLPGAEVSPLVRIAAEIALYLFPNLALFDLKQQAAYGLMPSWNELLIMGGYGISYTFIILTLSVLVFRRRELA